MRPVLLVAAFLILAPVIMGGSSCHPHAPPALPPPPSLEKVDNGDVIVTMAGGGGGDLQIFGDPTLGGGLALGVEYRPITEIGLSGSMTVGRGGNDSVGTYNTLFQYGVGVDFYVPVPRIKFHPLLLEIDLHVTHLSNRSVTISPSFAVSTGFYVSVFELCATLRLSWGVPGMRGHLLVVNDDGDTSFLMKSIYIEPGAAIWFHVKRAAVGPFFRYTHAMTNDSSESGYEHVSGYLVGGFAVRYRF